MRPLADPASLQPGALALLFLAVLLVVLPVAAVAQERQLAALTAQGGSLDRRTLYTSAVITHLLLQLGSWLAWGGAPARLLAGHDVTPRDLAAGGAALAVGLVTLLDRFAPRDPRQRDRLLLIAPRTARERLAFAGVAISAGFAEEIAYRGVLFLLLAHYLGGWWLPALVSAAAFGVAHLFQGWRSAVLAGAIGLLAQVVTGVTGTLWVAIVVHILHDMIAGAVIARRAGRSLREDVTAAVP
jgi:membrane protease YdiL (CAAX protease family)